MSFDKDFMTVDPFAGREPWNNDAEPESDEYDCAGCYDCKVQMSKPGEICTECLMYIAEYA